MNTDAKTAIQSWLKTNPTVFSSRLDGDMFTLIELASGKQITIDAAKITAHRFTPHPQGLKDYLNLVLDSGVQIVLCHVGLAFEPSVVSTGVLPDAPPVVCMTDYFTLSGNLMDLMADPTRKKETLALFNVLISILDGAKAVGLEVGAEEEQLNARLNAFESSL